MRRDFDYESRVEGESVRIFVPHHASNRGKHCGQSWKMPVVCTLEVIVDRSICERLKDSNALLGVSYANTRVPTQTPHARAFTGRICGITYRASSYPLPWLVLGSRPADGLMADHINRNGLDNRLQKLRWAKHWQNIQNRPGWGSASKTMGVHYTQEEAEAEAIRIHEMVYGPFARSMS